MSKLLRYVVVYLVLGMGYSYHLNEKANNALKAEEQKAMQRRNTAYSYMIKKRKDDTEYSAEELKTRANRTFMVVAGSSVLFVLIGLAVIDPNSR